MAIGMIGRKCGMTRVFTDAGASVPVSVIEALPNRIAAVRASEKNGYSALQVTTGSKKASRLSKAEAGHFAKCGIDAGRGLWEFRTEGESGEWEVGSALTVDMFEEGQKVDVTGSTIGKGYAGAVKRHNFSMQDATHGNSLAHRAAGSIGQCQTPGRVFKGKKMAGHMGDVKRTAVNLEVVRVDMERNLILIKGAVPGAKGGDVLIHPSIKSPKKV